MGQIIRKRRPALWGMSLQMRIDFELNMHVWNYTLLFLLISDL
jgi:hypothetical protein